MLQRDLTCLKKETEACVVIVVALCIMVDDLWAQRLMFFANEASSKAMLIAAVLKKALAFSSFCGESRYFTATGNLSDAPQEYKAR